MQPIIAIIETDDSLRSYLASICAESGWQTMDYASAAEFIEAEHTSPPDLLIYSVPGSWKDGTHERIIARLQSWHDENTKTQLLLLLPRGFEESDHLALRIGARNILHKPIDRSDISSILAKAAEGIGRRSRRKALKKRIEKPEGFGEILGSSDAMHRVLELAKRVAESDFTSVMILGEPGTGKGAIAKAIHLASDRRPGPFIEINCGAIPKNLLESEFFGYEKGAFTDAKEEKIGLFECADGGTIFLDEVGEIDYGLQAKLLKFLDSRTIRRISGTRFLPVDVRIISATNSDLRRAVAQKRFRSDLYYRLNVLEIHLPPLRERREDIRLIAEAYTERFASRMNKRRLELGSEALRVLDEYQWPGNIRELINVIERAVLLNTTGTIGPADIPIENKQQETTVSIKAVEETIRVDLPPEGAALEEVEKGLILATLDRTDGNVTQAARLLKVGRGTLRYKMKKYGIDPAETKKNLKNGAYEPVGVSD
jgi:two-component system response regulator AtoC